MKNVNYKLFTTIIFGLLFSTGVCNASTIFTDDFNLYSNGNIEGQGGWTGNGVDEFFTVEDSIVKEGAKALKSSLNFPGVELVVSKTGNLVSEGLMTFYVRRDINSPGGSLRLSEGLSVKITMQFVRGSGDTGSISYRDSAGVFKNLSNMTPNIWYQVQIQWISIPSSKIRYRVNEEAWTTWIDPQVNWNSGLDKISFLRSVVTNGTHIYFDDIRENPILNKTPVLIVPGIMGTEMKKGENLLWANVSEMILDIGDQFMDPLAFNYNLSPIDDNVYKNDIIRNPLNVYDYTDSLINEFQNQGYIENPSTGSGQVQTLFTFPYDWRYGVSGKYADGGTNVDLLKQKITEIMTQTGSTKVDIVAHSMGGLIVKRYVLDNPIHNIDKAVFVGVPNTGAPKAVKTLLQGDNFGISFLGVNFLSYAEIKKISENMPGVYDLLPSEKYYNTKGSYVRVVDRGNLGELNVTIKDLNYEETKSFLVDDHGLNSTAVNNGENLNTQIFNDFDLRTAGIDLYSINGCKTPTMSNITETRAINVFGQNLVDYKLLKWGLGDGTVPLESSTNLPIDQSRKYYSLKGEHGKMPSFDGIRQEIVNLLTGSTLSVDDKIITEDLSKCKLDGKTISVFSPVDIFVTDQNGNKLGLAEDKSIINEISNADFQIWGDHKFLYLPTDDGQIYDINLKGTGTGDYTIKSQNIVNSEITETEVFSNLPVTSDLTGQINLNNETTLTIIQYPGNEPETIFPSSKLSIEQSEDFLPPSSTAILSGVKGQEDFYRSDVNILLNSTDNLSGVLSLNYNIDGMGYQKVLLNSTEINISSEGKHTITFFTTDRAGNNEEVQTISFTIDKTAPELSIEFDPIIKDIKFKAIDNTEVEIIDNGDEVKLTDKSGNTTQVLLKEKDRKKKMSAEIKSLMYNDENFDISKNKMVYKWNYSESGELIKLSQQIKSKKDYNISADFDGKNTIIKGKDATGKISQIFSGLKVLKVATNQGDFDWSY